MPDLTGFPALDVAIGLAFMYFLLSIVCSSIQEGVSTVLKLRADNLEKGIRTLIADRAKADAFFDNWRIRALSPETRNGKAARKPSYIPSRTFALALVDTLVPDADRAADDEDVLRKARGAVEAMDKNAVGRKLLEDAVARAEGKRDVLRGELEDAFNATMDRASGWYKRKVQGILFVIALLVAVGLNADTFNVAQRLFQDDALRAQVVAQAVKAAEEGEPPAAGDVSAATVEAQLEQARATALPFGWRDENIPQKFGSLGSVGGVVAAVLVKVLGLLFTAFALTLGAPFWFDVLGRFAKLRSSGNRIGTPKDDETAPVDRDERKIATASAGDAPPPPIADLERERSAGGEERPGRRELRVSFGRAGRP